MTAYMPAPSLVCPAGAAAEPAGPVGAPSLAAPLCWTALRHPQALQHWSQPYCENPAKIPVDLAVGAAVCGLELPVCASVPVLFSALV